MLSIGTSWSMLTQYSNGKVAKTFKMWNHFRWIWTVSMKHSVSNHHHQTVPIKRTHSFSRDTNVSAWLCFKTPSVARVIQEWQLNFIDPYDFALCLLYSIAQRSTVNLLIQQKNRRFSEQVFAYRKWNSPKRNMQKSVPGWFIFML